MLLVQVVLKSVLQVQFVICVHEYTRCCQSNDVHVSGRVPSMVHSQNYIRL